jgi:hypothetical protein
MNCVYVHHSALKLNPSLYERMDEFLAENCRRVKRVVHDNTYKQTMLTNNGIYTDWSVYHMYYEFNFKYEEDMLMFKLSFVEYVEHKMEKYNSYPTRFKDQTFIEQYR